MVAAHLKNQDANVYFDSHCHFDFAAFDEDRSSVWERCHQAGVRQLVIPGVSPEQWKTAAEICASSAGIYHGAGLHPYWIEEWLQNPLSAASENLRLQLLAAVQAAPYCIAIGECGLDALIRTPLDQQEKIFQVHLQVAAELKLPILIHCRKAHNEVIRLLRAHKPVAGGVIHGFSGSLELAQQYVALGFYLGIGGTITYARANKTRETVKKIPLEMLLLETDAPDMPLQGQQGQRNSPENIPAIAQVLAQLRNEPLQKIAAQTTANSNTLFGL